MSALPHPVRQRVVSLAAEVLGSLDPDQVPVSLRHVARFTASKRARLGGSAIAAALDTDPGFRRRVLEAARAAHPGLVEALAAGPPPPAADPVDVAAVAYLLRADGWDEVVAAAVAEVRRAGAEEQAARTDVTTVRLREQLTAARAEAREDRERSKAEIDRLKAENAALRRRVSQSTDEAVRAEEASLATAAESARLIELAEMGRASAEAEARRLRGRLADVEEALSTTRRAGREGRCLETARLGLLLDTLADAAAGLRRELALPVSGGRPADTVEAVEPAAASAQSRPTTAPRSTTCSPCRARTSSSTDTTSPRAPGLRCRSRRSAPVWSNASAPCPPGPVRRSPAYSTAPMSPYHRRCHPHKESGCGSARMVKAPTS